MVKEKLSTDCAQREPLWPRRERSSSIALLLFLPTRAAPPLPAAPSLTDNFRDVIAEHHRKPVLTDVRRERLVLFSLRLFYFSLYLRERERERERARERKRERKRERERESLTGSLELRFHAVSLADSEMDVRFYPAPPASVGSCTLPTDSGLDYYHANKVTFLSTLLAHVVPTCADSDAVSAAHEPAHRLIRWGDRGGGEQALDFCFHREESS